MKKYIVSLFLIPLFALNINAQHPLSLYYLEGIPQTININPAMTPRANVFVGIPVINSVYTGFNADILSSNILQVENGELITPLQMEYDYEAFYKRIGKAANFDVDFLLMPFIVGWKTNRGYVSIGITEKANAAFALPKDLFSIIENGGFKLGSIYDFSALNFDMSYHREFSFGYAYEISNKLRLGAHLKVLQGLAAVKTNIEKFDIGVDADRQYGTAIDAEIMMSAPLEVDFDNDNLPSSAKFTIEDISDAVDKGLLNFSNPGFAFDLGAEYELNNRWSFSGSINDLGFISWKSDLTSISLKGDYYLPDLVMEIGTWKLDSLVFPTDNIEDSIKDAFEFNVGSKSFKTSLGPKIYLGTQYHLNHYLSLGAISRTTFRTNNFRQEFNVSANFNLYHMLTTNVNYTYTINGINTVGFGFALRAAFLQLYFAADYMPITYREYQFENDNSSIIGPVGLENFNFMVGLNLIFGSKGWKDKPMHKVEPKF